MRHTAPQLEQVLEPESMEELHLGQEVWLKLTGCILVEVKENVCERVY